VKSVIAALRTLVLPFGATSGRRIILDGVTGTILFYDALNRLRLQLASSTDQGEIRFYPTTGDMSDYALIDTRSEIAGEAGVFIRSSLDVSNQYFGTLYSSNSVKTGMMNAAFEAVGGLHLADATIAQSGYFVADVLKSGNLYQSTGAWHAMWLDNTHPLAGVLAFPSGGNNLARLFAREDTGVTNQASVTVSEDGSVTVSGSSFVHGADPVVTLANSAISTATTGAFNTTETVTDNVAANLVTGAVYEVMWTGGIQATTATDTLLYRIRGDNLAGTQLAGGRYVPNTTSSAGPLTLRALYTAVATGSKTFVVTMQRNAGAGNFTRIGAVDNQSIMTVKRVG
jgi:hypothetical protein